MSESAAHVIPDWELHHRLGRALEYANLKVKDMAEHLGYSERTMTDYLSGKTVPRDAVVRQWAARCSVPYEWLVGTMTCFDVPLAAVPDPDGATQMQLAYGERPGLTAVRR